MPTTRMIVDDQRQMTCDLTVKEATSVEYFIQKIQLAFFHIVTADKELTSANISLDVYTIAVLL